MDWLVRAPRRSRQVAVVRIGVAAAWLVSLVCEWPVREGIYGPDGPWAWPMAGEVIRSLHSFSLLSLTPGPGFSLCVHLVAAAAAVQLLLGWHTRTAAVFFLLGVLSLQNYAWPLGYGADTAVRLTALYLVAVRSGRAWSLDAYLAGRGRKSPGVAGVVLWVVLGGLLAAGAAGPGAGRLRLQIALWLVWAGQAWAWWVRRRPDAGGARGLEALANAVHNAVVVVMMCQVVVLYYTAGMSKLAEATWRQGTAVYYALHVTTSPWPSLTALICSSSVLVAALTWGTVVLQVSFPFALLHPRTKNWALIATFFEHCGIALLMALWYFSLAVLAADAIWLPTGPLRRLGGRLRTQRERASAYVREAHADAAPVSSPRPPGALTPPRRKA
ncbi:HTTM domain-containing protein [Streptomyces roseifaciens]|uniref:HTTM domain-containing protein n=1 Tax=Streptomyces roseifaciens TaxID=1488406 RepID=UPI0009A035E6|nr:HTTM domain-containing protein [Streptomyces roseifaciens]